MSALMSRGFQSLIRNKRVQLASVSIPLLYLYSSMSSPKEVSRDFTTSKDWPSTPYQPRYSKFPYTEEDFRRQDSSSDGSFYSSPRFVTHIDDSAINSLRRYYDSALPEKGRILDFCSSWVSHYPERIEKAKDQGDMTIVGMGMNDAEFVAC